MAAATMVMEHAAFAVSERDGVTLIYDTPTRTVFADRLDAKRFGVLLALAFAATWPLWWNARHYAVGYYGATLFTVAGGFAAWRYAQLHVHAVAWWRTLRPVLWRDAWLFLGGFAAQWLADAMRGDSGGVGLLGWPYMLLASWLAFKLARRGAWDMAYKVGQEIKVLPRAIVGIDALRARWARQTSDRSVLQALATFEADAPEMTAAWESGHTDAIERLLRAGDVLNRASWQKAINLFNAAKEDIDLARGRLRHLVRESEAALVPYQVVADEAGERSGVLAGDMDAAAPPQRDFAQRADYGRGVGSAVARAATGGNWQVAAAVVVFSGIMMAVNHQKLLRQLKELEGQVKAQAESVRGDIGLIGDLMRMRLAPRMGGMISLIGTLEDRLGYLRDDEAQADADQAQADAYLLACALREAKHELEAKAGD